MIDAHQHFWQFSQPFNYSWMDPPAMAAIRRDFLPTDLEPQLREMGIDRCVFVQTQHDLAENRWVLGLAEMHPFIAGVVGWVDLASPDCERQVEEFRRFPKFVGARHITQDERDDDFIIREDVIRGLRTLEKHGVPFDLLFYVKHLPHAAKLARQLPNLKMVIDHLAKPRIREGITAGWIAPLREAARFPNMYCKLSGLVTEADWKSWKPADFRPYIQEALEVFGPERCMYGSDWPVCELAGSYRQVFEALNDCLGPISAADRQRIFEGTAREFYRLP